MLFIFIYILGRGDFPPIFAATYTQPDSKHKDASGEHTKAVFCERLCGDTARTLPLDAEGGGGGRGDGKARAQPYKHAFNQFTYYLYDIYRGIYPGY